jgi:hypothetical protein
MAWADVPAAGNLDGPSGSDPALDVGTSGARVHTAPVRMDLRLPIAALPWPPAYYGVRETRAAGDEICRSRSVTASFSAIVRRPCRSGPSSEVSTEARFHSRESAIFSRCTKPTICRTRYSNADQEGSGSRGNLNDGHYGTDRLDRWICRSRTHTGPCRAYREGALSLLSTRN